MSEEESISNVRLAIITITVVMASMMELIDTSIVNVALPHIQGNLGANLTQVSWVVTAYVFGNIIMIPITGWCSEFFGRKKFYLSCISIFIVSSIICGQATNVWELIGFRLIQGLSGGGLLPISRTILIENFPDDKLAMANALFSMGVVIGPTIGPTLGGWLTTSYSWRWIFYINIPIGAVAFAMAWLNVEDVKTKIHKLASVDWWGLILLIVGFGSLQIMLEQGERDNWFSSHFITAMLIISIVGILLFVWRELTAEDPMVDLKVLSEGNVAIGSFFGFILGFGLYASVFVFPLYLQDLLGYSAFQTGLILLPSALTAGLMMPVVGWIVDKGMSTRLMASIGFFIFFIFCWQMSSQSLASGTNDFIFPLILRGIGLGCLSVPINTLSYTGLKGHNLAEATGFISMTKKLGGAFGIALVSSFLDWRNQLHWERLSSHVTQYSDQVQQRMDTLYHGLMSSGSASATAHQQGYESLAGTVMQQVQMMSYNDIFLVIGVFFVICIPFLILTYDVKKIKQYFHNPFKSRTSQSNYPEKERYRNLNYSHEKNGKPQPHEKVNV